MMQKLILDLRAMLQCIQGLKVLDDVQYLWIAHNGLQCLRVQL